MTSEYMDELDMIEHIKNNYECEQRLTEYFHKMDERQEHYWDCQFKDMIKHATYNMLSLNRPEITFDNVFDNNPVYNIIVCFENKYKYQIKITITFTDDCPMIIKHGLIACYTKNNIIEHYPDNWFNDKFKTKYNKFIKSINVSDPEIIFIMNQICDISKIFKIMDNYFCNYLNINDFFKKIYIHYPNILDIDTIIEKIYSPTSKVSAQHYDNIIKNMIIFNYNCYNLYIEIQDQFIHNPLNCNIIDVLNILYKNDFSLLKKSINMFNITLFDENIRKQEHHFNTKVVYKHRHNKQIDQCYFKKNYVSFNKKHFKNYSTFMRNIH